MGVHLIAFEQLCSKVRANPMILDDVLGPCTVSLGGIFLSSENRSSGLRVSFWATSVFSTEELGKNHFVCWAESGR